MSNSAVGKSYRLILAALVAGSLIFHLAILWESRWKIAAGYGDFIIFYTGAQIINDGKSKELFKIETQNSYQSKFDVPQLEWPLPFNHVTGDLVIVMDGDLQDSPEVISEFLRKYEQGFDVVYAQRVVRKEGWPLRLCYFLFYRLLLLFSSVKLPLDAGDFALLSRRVVDELRHCPEHQRYLRGLRAWVGFRQIGISVERSERFSGESKYTLYKLFSLALDGIFAFSIVPLRMATILGLATTFMASLFAAYSLYVKMFLNQSPEGFTALIVTIIFVSGVQLLFLGIIGEYLGRVYEETKGRPHYIIDRIVGR